MGRADSVKFHVHPSVILWLSILYYLRADLVLPFLAAAVLHETGHALALRYLGHPPSSITVTFAGAAMETETLDYRSEFFAALAGPLFSLLLGAVFPLWPKLAVYSVILGLFNLLPIPGLDGGRMLESLLLLYRPEEHARKVSRIAALAAGGTVFCGGLYLSGPMGFGLWPIVLAALILIKALTAAL